MTLRRALAILLVVTVVQVSPAAAQTASTSQIRTRSMMRGGCGPRRPGRTNALAPEAAAAPSEIRAASLVPSTSESLETPLSSTHPLLEVPVVTWLCGGLAAALFGVALGFGISAANIDHRAGIDLSPMGVDLGLTRRTVLAGQTDATIANGLFIGAGVVAVIGFGLRRLQLLSPPPARSARRKRSLAMSALRWLLLMLLGGCRVPLQPRSRCRSQSRRGRLHLRE